MRIHHPHFRTTKRVYQNQLKVQEYYWFDPFNPEDWAGFELQQGVYQTQAPDNQNRLISPRLKLALVRWHGIYEGVEAIWLRWAKLNGQLLPTSSEERDFEARRANDEAQRAEAQAQRANDEAQRADAEAQRAEVQAQRAEAEMKARQAAEAEIARLKALLAEKK